MGTTITKVWREDREIEESLYSRSQAIATHLRGLGGRVPTSDDLVDLIGKLSIELDRLYLELHQNHIALGRLSERMDELEGEARRIPDIQRLREQSKEKALEFRSRLGLKEDPMKVDGFAKIRGLLSKYAKENEDSVEFLRRSREDE